ncbi:hypothetical protein ONE63_001272 [Megalurothrips usitatus]|uniref:Uncharacterized protein n=1 Tax=Megalurothrips usitatus TaxID=439358 RepID=A0AAV7XG84_9NEOP|nr:hypothetical protein ONE63_001272 [Megalurothrips usitatus]
MCSHGLPGRAPAVGRGLRRRVLRVRRPQLPRRPRPPRQGGRRQAARLLHHAAAGQQARPRPLQAGGRGRGPGAVPAVRLPVLRGVGGGALGWRLARLPVAAARGALAAAAALAAHPPQAGRQLRVQGAGQHLQQGGGQAAAGPKEAPVPVHLSSPRSKKLFFLCGENPKQFVIQIFLTFF